MFTIILLFFPSKSNHNIHTMSWIYILYLRFVQVYQIISLTYFYLSGVSICIETSPLGVPHNSFEFNFTNYIDKVLYFQRCKIYYRLALFTKHVFYKCYTSLRSNNCTPSYSFHMNHPPVSRSWLRANDNVPLSTFNTYWIIPSVHVLLKLHV